MTKRTDGSSRKAAASFTEYLGSLFLRKASGKADDYVLVGNLQRPDDSWRTFGIESSDIDPAFYELDPLVGPAQLPIPAQNLRILAYRVG